MIYGNHEKRKGDIVKIARWDDKHMEMLSKLVPKGKDPGAIKFEIWHICYKERMIYLKSKIVNWAVSLDDTNLIRVGRLS